MTTRRKKLLSNLLFVGGFLLAVLGVVLSGSVSLAGDVAAVLVFGILALGVVTALAGIVIGFIPARRS